MTDEPQKPTYDELLEELIGMVNQFAIDHDDGLGTSALSALEGAFETLERAGRARMVSERPERWELVEEERKEL